MEEITTFLLNKEQECVIFNQKSCHFTRIFTNDLELRIMILIFA